MTKIYYLGNNKFENDNNAFEAVAALKKIPEFKNISFEYIDLNQDLPLVTADELIIVDTVLGVSNIELITEEDLSQFITKTSTTAHDYDLGFQLKYLKKLQKINRFFIIALPQRKLNNTDYLRIQSILRKLVAQDIQGS